MWDPYLQKDVDKLEKVQRQGARFIAQDYRSREPGCVTKMLQLNQLPTLQTRRKEIRLKTMYQIVEDRTPALPFANFLEFEKANKRKVKPKRFQDCISQNPMEKYAINNTRGLKVPVATKEAYKNSFFIKTAIDWNELPENVVTAPSVDAFTGAVRAYISSQTAGGAALLAAPQ